MGINGGVNRCSSIYSWAHTAGAIEGGFALGGAAGMRAAGAPGSAGPRTTFSHFFSRSATNPKSKKFIPRLNNWFGRWLTRGNNRMNGNYVTPQRHYRHDANYYGHWKGANYRLWGDRLSPRLAMIDRIPGMWWGLGAGSVAATLGTVSGGDCGCQ